MPRPGISIPPLPGVLTLLLLVLGSATPLSARNPKLSRYPLRVHVLASDESYKVQRMSPADSVVCDAIDGMLSTVSPNPTGPISLSGLSGDPCSLHPEMVSGRLMGMQSEDFIFSGAGRADLVSPPSSTVGVNFRYSDCSPVRVYTGFQSQPARWKKPGQKLEVLLPSQDIPVAGRPLPPVKCTFSVAVHDFVYLLLRNGSIIQVSKEDYWSRPGLRVFLSGRPETIQQRLQRNTISAHPSPTQ